MSHFQQVLGDTGATLDTEKALKGIGGQVYYLARVEKMTLVSLAL